MSAEQSAEKDAPACGSCGEPAPYTITLRGEPTPACLRHLNHWRSPVEQDADACEHDWVFDGYFWHHCRNCGRVS